MFQNVCYVPFSFMSEGLQKVGFVLFPLMSEGFSQMSGLCCVLCPLIFDELGVTRLCAMFSHL